MKCGIEKWAEKKKKCLELRNGVWDREVELCSLQNVCVEERSAVQKRKAENGIKRQSSEH